MTLDDLARTLADAVATGRIGTPVALRVHAVVSEPECDLSAALEQLMQQLAEPLFGRPGRVSVRRDADERVLHVLVSYAAGQTALLTLARVGGSAPRLELLVTGNHGVLRLEGGECFAGLNGHPAPRRVDRHRGAMEAGVDASGSEMPNR